MSDRIALCVGINVFKNYAEAALQGCVNDAHDMSAVLQEQLGFKKSDITLLTDDGATKANIMGKLREMVAGAKAGKYTHLVFSLSSHGTQVPDLSQEEPDRADEAFCPYDLAQDDNGWDPQYIIVDNELRDLFVQLPRNVLLEAYLDTCHSGTGLKSIDLLLGRKPRFLPPPSLEAFRKVEGRRQRGLAHALREARPLEHQILWAACRSDQTSADARIDNGWHGAFTYFFCKELRATKNGQSRAAVLRRVRADLAGRYSQVPQLECAATTKKAKLGTLPSAGVAGPMMDQAEREVGGAPLPV